MKRIILCLVLLCSPAWASFTLVQATKSALHPCGGGSSCSMTVTSTGAGHLLVLMVQFGSTHTIKQTGMTGGGTWVHNGGDSAGTCNISNGSAGGVDCAYVLSSSSGATTISWSMDTNTFHDLAFLYEFSFTGSSVAYDTAGTLNISSFTTNPTAPALTLTGTNDVILEGLIGSNNPMTTIDGAFTGNGLYDSVDSPVAAAYAVNTASGTPPTWGNGNNLFALNAVAFKEVSSGATKTCTLSTMGAGPC